MCKPQPGKRDGVKWGICHNGGNMVYLEPRKIKIIAGKSQILENILTVKNLLIDLNQNFAIYFARCIKIMDQKEKKL